MENGRSASSQAPGVVIDAAFITTSESLALGLKLGRVAARATLLQRYSGFVEQVLVRIFNWDPRLPELVERVFERAMGDAEQLDAPSMTDHAIENWLLGHIVVVAQRRLRWRRLLPIRARSVELPGLSAASTEELARFYRRLDRLAPIARISFCLVYVAELSHEDVANAFNISLRTFERQLSRAVVYVRRIATQNEPAKPRFRAAG